jgi:hypothetical protein
MPRFYFHVCNGTGFTEDQEGQELPDLDAARQVAASSARSIMADDVRRGELDLSSFIEIEDFGHQLVHTLCFEDAVDLTRRHSDSG